MEVNIDALIEERERIRAIEKQLTIDIKIARESLKKESPKVVCGGVSHETFLKVQYENKRLRRLIAILKRVDNNTYAKIGEFLGVSASRARELVEGERRYLLSLEAKCNSEKSQPGCQQ